MVASLVDSLAGSVGSVASRQGSCDGGEKLRWRRLLNNDGETEIISSSAPRAGRGENRESDMALIGRLIVRGRWIGWRMNGG
jgi:hypothetical protein